MRATFASGTRPADLLRTIDGAVAGDERDATELVQYCLPPITTYLAARQAEHPEALANQVMAEVVYRLPRLSFDTREQFWNYLYKVAKSRLVDEKRGARPEYVAQPVDDLDFGVNGFADQVVDRAWISSLMEALTADQKQVIHLRFSEDLSLAETAHRTGRSVNAVKSMQRRALAALAAAAAAVVILLVLLGARLFGAASVNVQSLQPAGGTEIVGSPNAGLAISAPGVNNQRLESNRPAEEIEIQPIESDSGRSVPWDAARGLIGPRPPTDPVRTPAEENDSRAETPYDAVPGSEVVETPPTESGLPAVAATEPAALPSPAESSSPETPPYDIAAADTVGFNLMTTGQLWIDIDVLYNDYGAAIPDSLRVATQPSAGLAEVVETATGRQLRYHPTRPGEHTMYYEVCTADRCQTVPLTVPTSWYDDALCMSFEPTIIGTPGHDVLVGTAGNDIIFGLDGDDVINGGGGFDVICGGPGSDALSGDSDADVLIGGSGNDYLIGGDGNDTLLGNDGDDQLFGGSGADTGFGGDGNDVLNGDADDDSLYGEFGGDALNGGDGDDRIFGGPGVDSILDGAGADLLHGGPQADTLASTNDGAHNRLFGGLGPDTLVGTSPLDTLDGQADHDVCSASVPAINCESFG